MSRKAEILKRLEELNQDVSVAVVAQLGMNVPKEVIQHLDTKATRNVKLLVKNDDELKGR